MCSPVAELEPLQETLTHVLQIKILFHHAFSRTEQQRAVVAPGSRQLAMGTAAARSGRTVPEVRAAQQASIPAGRFGTPQEFGAICAFLCSVHAGYMTGQNVLADGGAYPGTY